MPPPTGQKVGGHFQNRGAAPESATFSEVQLPVDSLHTVCLSGKHWPIQEVGSRNANIVKDEPSTLKSIEPHLDTHV